MNLNSEPNQMSMATWQHFSDIQRLTINTLCAESTRFFLTLSIPAIDAHVIIESKTNRLRETNFILESQLSFMNYISARKQINIFEPQCAES